MSWLAPGSVDTTWSTCPTWIWSLTALEVSTIGPGQSKPEVSSTASAFRSLFTFFPTPLSVFHQLPSDVFCIQMDPVIPMDPFGISNWMDGSYPEEAPLVIQKKRL